MSELLYLMLIILPLVVVLAGVISVLTDPERIDEEEKARVKRKLRYRRH